MANHTEQPIESTEAPAESGNTTTDITEDFAGVNTFEDVATPDTEEPSAEAPATGTEEATPAPSGNVAEASPVEPALESEDTPPVSSAPTPDVDNLNQRLQEVEQQNAQYAQAQYQAQVQQYERNLQQQLEQQGYLPEQAAQYARQQVEGQVQLRATQQQQQEQLRHEEGKRNAAIHFYKQYKLDNIDDLQTLEKYNDPQSMEDAAKRIQSDKAKDAEIAKLRAQLVPSQTFDDSQSTPAASTDEDRWLERYNQGDRSSQAAAAARRAAGLGIIYFIRRI